MKKEQKNVEEYEEKIRYSIYEYFNKHNLLNDNKKIEELKLVNLTIIVYIGMLYKYNTKIFAKGYKEGAMKYTMSPFKNKKEEIAEIIEDDNLNDILEIVNNIFGMYSGEGLRKFLLDFGISILGKELSYEELVSKLKHFFDDTDSFKALYKDKNFKIINDVSYCYNNSEKEKVELFLKENIEKMMRISKNAKRENEYIFDIEKVNGKYEIVL